VFAACTALALGMSVAAQQTVQDRTTFVTFSGPVSIPGKTLPAGTYTFRLADSQTDRHVVQIFDKDGANLMATLLAVPAERADQEGEPVVTFKETASDQAPAVRYWYYAGERGQRVRLSQEPGDHHRPGIGRVGDVGRLGIVQHRRMEEGADVAREPD
jgi:hypothetical protein